MEALHKVILSIAGDQQPDLPPQRDGAESIISSMDLDGSMRSRVRSVNDASSGSPPRHPGHNYNSSLRYPFPPQRSISDKESAIEKPPLSEHPFYRNTAEPLISEPSESSSQRLSTSSSDVLGWDQPSIRQQPANFRSRPNSDSRHQQQASAGAVRFSLNDEEMTDAFPERIGCDSIFTASSSRSIAHPWPPDSSANSVLNYDSTSIYSDRRQTGTETIAVGFNETRPTELRSRSVPGPFDRQSGSTDRRSDPTTGATEYDSMDFADQKVIKEKGIATRVQAEEFEKSAFKNSAVLCDV